jgi:hypothetical protein
MKRNHALIGCTLFSVGMLSSLVILSEAKDL